VTLVFFDATLPLLEKVASKKRKVSKVGGFDATFSKSV
jgi:hypothetical protein